MDIKCGSPAGGGAFRSGLPGNEPDVCADCGGRYRSDQWHAWVAVEDHHAAVDLPDVWNLPAGDQRADAVGCIRDRAGIPRRGVCAGILGRHIAIDPSPTGELAYAEVGRLDLVSTKPGDDLSQVAELEEPSGGDARGAGAHTS